MKRLVVLPFLCAVWAVAQEPPKDMPKAKVEEKKDAEDDVQKTAERIAANAQKAGDRLKEKDPGQETRKIQDDIIKDIDALLKKAQQPPPMPPMMPDMNPMMPPPPMMNMNPMMPPPMMNMGMGMPPMMNPMKNMSGMGMPMMNMGMGTPPMPMGNMGMGNPPPQGSNGRRPKKDRRGEGEPMPEAKNDPPMMKEMGMGMGMGQPMNGKMDPKEGPMAKKDNTGAKDDPFGKSGPKRKDDQRFADLYKDVWGHLPDRLRQEMDLYYREQFMPRYSELLRQYYAAIAEQKKKGDGDR